MAVLNNVRMKVIVKEVSGGEKGDYYRFLGVTSRQGIVILATVVIVLAYAGIFQAGSYTNFYLSF